MTRPDWLQFKLKIHVVLEMCVNVAQKCVHARPLHRAVSHADWSDAGKRRTFLKILHLPKRTRSNLKRSISVHVRILLLSAMPSLSSSESTAIIVVAIVSTCIHALEGFIDCASVTKKYVSICAECQWRKFARPKPSFFHGYFWRADSELDRFSISAFWPPPKVVNDNHF